MTPSALIRKSDMECDLYCCEYWNSGKPHNCGSVEHGTKHSFSKCKYTQCRIEVACYKDHCGGLSVEELESKEETVENEKPDLDTDTKILPTVED